MNQLGEANIVNTRTNAFIEKARKLHGFKYDYSKVVYVVNDKSVIIICPTHGDFLQKPADHLSRNKSGAKGCHRCCASYPHTQASWIQKAKEIHGEKYDYSQTVYTGGKNKVIIRCVKHDLCFEQQATSHVGKRPRGCPKCGLERSVSAHTNDTEYFLTKARAVHGNTYDYSLVKYTITNDYVTIICSKHGEFDQTPHNHLIGKGCPRCKMSHGEKHIANYLKSLNIMYVQQKKFEDCKNKRKLPFDFYLPEYDAIIEFDGKQHFEPVDIFGGDEGFLCTRLNDEIKNKFAAETNRPMLRIKYDQNIELSIDLFIIGLN